MGVGRAEGERKGEAPEPGRRALASSTPALYLRLSDSHFHDSIIHGVHTVAFLKSPVWTPADAIYAFFSSNLY